MMIFAGTLQVLFGAALFYAFYLLALALEAGDRVRRLAAVVASQLLGLALAGIVLLPAALHLPRTARALGMTLELASMGSVRPAEMLGLFFGAGGAVPGVEDLDGASLYLGSLVLPLAGVALLATRDSDSAFEACEVVPPCSRWLPVIRCFASRSPVWIGRLPVCGRGVRCAPRLLPLPRVILAAARRRP